MKVSSTKLQAVQGMSKLPATSGPSPNGKAVIKQGIPAKGTIKVPKSSKKKVIVNSLLKMMSNGHMMKQMSSSGNMQAHKKF